MSRRFIFFTVNNNLVSLSTNGVVTVLEVSIEREANSPSQIKSSLTFFMSYNFNIFAKALFHIVNKVIITK